MGANVVNRMLFSDVFYPIYMAAYEIHRLPERQGRKHAEQQLVENKGRERRKQTLPVVESVVVCDCRDSREIGEKLIE